MDSDKAKNKKKEDWIQKDLEHKIRKLKTKTVFIVLHTPARNSRSRKIGGTTQ